MVIYRGPSMINGAPVRAVLTFDSRNRKTGPMAQLWIIADTTIPPHMVAATGADHAICGDCPFRPANRGGCYVDLSRAPLSVWKGSNGAPVVGAGAIRHALRGSPVRLGAYGDPAALPLHVIQMLARMTGHRLTGYSHTWRARPDLAPYVMASVHSEAEAREAHALGFRTFRVRSAGSPNLPSEITCPSETRGLTCDKCLLCHGSRPGVRSITIPAHGASVRKALTVVQ